MLSRNMTFLLQRRGQVVTFNSKTDGSYSPSTGTTSGGTSTSYSVKAYFANYSIEELSTEALSLGDRRVAVSVVDTSGNPIPEPDAEDTFEGVGDTVIVKSVQKIYNSGTLVCYVCMVRE